MGGEHLFRLSAGKPDDECEAGSRYKAVKGKFPMLEGMSLYKLVLRPKGVREPHWHPNADELGYCIRGELLVSFYHTGDFHQTFLVKAGETFWIPSGALHMIENVGREDAELIVEFSHESPEEFNLSSFIGMYSNAVLGNTWGVKSDYFSKLPRPLKDKFAALRKTETSIPEEARYASPFRFGLEGSEPILEKAGGSARMARQSAWPILQRQALFSLRLTGKGMREPHWHPETAELGYINAGKGRMTILDDKGNADTYIIQAGDTYFIPKAYPHHIENLEGSDLHILIFFDQAMPRDIGFTGSLRYLPSGTLSPFLQVDPSFFDGLNKYYSDLFIVDKINPVDP